MVLFWLYTVKANFALNAGPDTARLHQLMEAPPVVTTENAARL
jgi:hypothetical protein